MTSGELVCRRRGWSTGGQIGDGVQDDIRGAGVQRRVWSTGGPLGAGVQEDRWGAGL
jgi:hypothetical protein